MHKRALSAAVASSAAVILLSACGGSGSTGGSTTTAPATGGASGTGAATATAAATLGADGERDATADLVIWTDSDRAPALTEYANKFGAEKGITVKVQIATEVRQQYKDATKVGKGPDVVVGAHDWLGELVQNGTVSPVQISADVAAKFAPSAVAATKYDGQTYGIPYAIENIALIRNKDLAPEAPTTMDDLVAKGGELKKAGKVSSVLVQFVSKVGNAYYAYPYLSAFGGGIFAQKANGDYDPTKLIVNSAESLKGAQVLADLGAQKVLSTNVDDTNMDTIFDTKKSAFMISGPWSIATAKKAGINYGISPLPSLTGGGAMKPFLGVQMFYVSSKAKNAGLAQEFVANVVPQKDFQLALFAAGNRPPALTEAYNEVAAADPDIKAWFEAGEGGLPMPNIPAMNSVWKPFGQATADIISGKSAAKARLDQAQKEILASLAKG